MEIIVFNGVNSNHSPRGYNSCVKVAYILAEDTYLVGIEAPMIFLQNYLKRFDLKQKIDFLREHADLDEPIDYYGIEASFKAYNKSKNKSSKEIVAFKKFEKAFYTIFEAICNDYDESIDRLFGTKVISELVSNGKLGFFNTDSSGPKSDNLLSIADILTLDYPDKNESTLFIINFEFKEEQLEIEDNLVEIEFLDCDNVAAENLDVIYGERGFIFPCLNNLTAIEVKTIENQMKEPLSEFKQIIDKWASLCNEKPNSIDGLTYFRETVKPVLQATDRQMFENPILKNTSRDYNTSNETELVFAQMPIYQIWNLFKKTNNFESELYNQLLDIKQKEAPKYEGRWPVIFLKPVQKHTDINSIMPEEVVSVRKTIKVD